MQFFFFFVGVSRTICRADRSARRGLTLPRPPSNLEGRPRGSLRHSRPRPASRRARGSERVGPTAVATCSGPNSSASMAEATSLGWYGEFITFGLFFVPFVGVLGFVYRVLGLGLVAFVGSPAFWFPGPVRRSGTLRSSVPSPSPPCSWQPAAGALGEPSESPAGAARGSAPGGPPEGPRRAGS